MTAEPDAYCFFQDIAPRPPLDAAFDRDYLLYAVAGALRLEVGDKRWLLPPSFAAWIPAKTEFKVEIQRPVTSCSVLSRPGICSTFPDQTTVIQMSPLTREMISHCRDWGKNAAQPERATAFFRALLDTCAALAESSVDVTRPTASDPALMRAVEATEAALTGAITAPEIAKAAAMSERTMQRRFSEELGATWAQTLTRLRMIRAIELLGMPDTSIIQVAGECGYASLSAFNRAFLAFADMTPTEFRAQL
ncbi:MAG: helix-turn-helix domain-containing protein [Boseongicola sp.]|nr:MAG: helix-turn-helix domain-containing protein [Boseongicola sp.]